MKLWFLYGCFFLIACSNNEKKITATDSLRSPTPVIANTDTTFIINNDTGSAIVPAISPIKLPSGIYQFLLPYNKQSKVEHTISFAATTYRLQERYRIGKRDSVILTQGTWAPSNGYIWLYREQIVSGRYTWKGDTLQYYSPTYKKNFSMQKLTPALNNAVLRTKKNGGAIFYGVGTEPFWSVELTSNDTLSFSLPEWAHPLKMKMGAVQKIKHSIIYSAQADSLSLRVVVLPYFCSDGMSDFIYSNKIEVQYNGTTYSGCGIRYR
jgi:uncharacterized membrane protein